MKNKERKEKCMLSDDDLESVSGGEEEPMIQCLSDIGGIRMLGNEGITINRVCRVCKSVNWFTEQQEHYYCCKCGNLIQ